MKVNSGHRSKFSNFSNWKEEAWKKSGLQRDSNPWPPRYRCDALPTELWSQTLGARSIYWVHIFPCSEMMWSLYEIIHICTAVIDESEPQYKYELFHLNFTHFTLTVPLSTHMYKWVVTLWLSSIPSREDWGRNTATTVSCYRNWDKLRRDEPLGLHADFTFWLNNFTCSYISGACHK